MKFRITCVVSIDGDSFKDTIIYEGSRRGAKAYADDLRLNGAIKRYRVRRVSNVQKAVNRS